MKAREYLANRGCTRLCRVTKLRNLPAILLEGLVCARDLAGDYRNDPARYDGAMDRVCCSLEYPNARYLQAVCRRDPDRVFREWTALYLGLEVLEREADLCPCNASRGKGAYIQKGLGEIGRMFEELPPGTVSPRPETMLPCCPTDDQAEILIRDRIPPGGHPGPVRGVPGGGGTGAGHVSPAGGGGAAHLRGPGPAQRGVDFYGARRAAPGGTIVGALRGRKGSPFPPLPRRGAKSLP